MPCHRARTCSWKGKRERSGPAGPGLNVGMGLLPPHKACQPQKGQGEEKGLIFVTDTQLRPLRFSESFYEKCLKWKLEGGFGFSFLEFCTKGQGE